MSEKGSFAFAATGTTQAEGAQAPSTLLGRAQEAIVHAAAATSAAGSVVANKVAAAGAECADCSELWHAQSCCCSSDLKD